MLKDENEIQNKEFKELQKNISFQNFLSCHIGHVNGN